jgi:hypothetical protein
MDYVSLRQLSTKLVLLFWRDLELHEPGIDSLHLSDQMIRDWKQRLTQVRYGSNRLGQRREDPHAIYLAVRAFYADLSHWALEEPARWAHWVAPNPIRSQDTRGMMKQRTRSQARMHQRTRELAPLLPVLVEAAETSRRHAVELLHAADAAAPGEWFEVAGAAATLGAGHRSRGPRINASGWYASSRGFSGSTLNTPGPERDVGRRWHGSLRPTVGVTHTAQKDSLLRRCVERRSWGPRC